MSWIVLLEHPLILLGGTCLFLFGMFWLLLRRLRPVSRSASERFIHAMLQYGFWIALCVTILGFGLSAWNTYMEKVQPVDAEQLAEKLLEPYQTELEAKEQQLQTKDEQIKALTDAITALTQADKPAGTINAALRALEQGRPEKAEAIFAEILAAKEAEGRQANQEAAAAARHLGALAFLTDTHNALEMYQKAVQLDPDNAEGWNQLGHLLNRLGQLDDAERAYRKVLAIAESEQDSTYRAIAYGNLGILYATRGDLDNAEQMHQQSLTLNQELGRKAGMADQYGSLGNLYFTRGDIDNAEQMYQQSLTLNQELGRKAGMASDYGNLGNLYLTRGDLEQAEAMWRKSLQLFQEMRHRYADTVQQWLDELPQEQGDRQ